MTRSARLVGLAVAMATVAGLVQSAAARAGDWLIDEFTSIVNPAGAKTSSNPWDKGSVQTVGFNQYGGGQHGSWCETDYNVIDPCTCCRGGQHNRCEPGCNSCDAGGGRQPQLGEAYCNDSYGGRCDNSLGDDCGHDHEHCCFDEKCWRRPVWTVDAGTIILTRSTPHPALLAVDTNTLDPLLNAGDLRFTSEAGYDISIAHSCGCGDSIFGRYFEVDDIHAGRSFIPPSGSFDIPMPSSLTESPVSPVDVSFTSRLRSAELNSGHCNGERIVWFAGFRYVEMRENLRYAFDLTDIDYNTINRLYGGQIGMDIRLHDHGGRIFFDGFMKAGVFGNVAGNQFSVIDNSGLSEAGHDARKQVAFVGDVGLSAVYQWTCHIAFRAGYEVMWLEGVAVTSDQIAVTNRNGLDGNGIDTVGGLFYHGALAGVSVAW